MSPTSVHVVWVSNSYDCIVNINSIDTSYPMSTREEIEGENPASIFQYKLKF